MCSLSVENAMSLTFFGVSFLLFVFLFPQEARRFQVGSKMCAT